MPKTKYKSKYAEDLTNYFLKFIEMRDEPDREDEYKELGIMFLEGPDGVFEKIPPKPCSGYPTFTKFAIKIGVTPRTITNWREKYPAFAEACEFADAIQDDILNERALTGAVDGRVAMKIRELKLAAKRNKEADEATAIAGKFGIEILKHISTESKLEVKEWDGEVVEDAGYLPKTD